MKLKDIKDVLTFRAFRPEPDDNSAPWSRRFSSENTLALNIGRRRVSWTALDKRGEFRDPGTQDGDFKDLVTQMGPEWRNLTDNGWCSVSLNHRFVITLEVNLSRRAGLEQQLKTNPKAVLGAKAERGKKYSILHNPESNTSILLAVEEEAINKTVSMMKESGLNAGRVAVGVYGMMLDLIEQVAEARRARAVSHPGEPFGSVVMVACNEGSVCVLSQREEQWTELRSRTDLYTDDMTPVLDIILPLIQNAGPGTNVVFMNSEAGCQLPELLRQRIPGVAVSDVTAPCQLWKLLTDS
ncbi:MAG TPA: hypothetical protein VG796_25515 [Verrucomicrobiales bacterium]|jgi:hypothetical protein|nr:hypothetical protein [Verrucomicrobiales bacterium]